MASAAFVDTLQNVIKTYRVRPVCHEIRIGHFFSPRVVNFMFYEMTRMALPLLGSQVWSDLTTRFIELFKIVWEIDRLNRFSHWKALTLRNDEVALRGLQGIETFGVAAADLR